MSNIKKRVNLINNKRIVVGDPNKVTKDEILLEEKGGKVSLKDNKGNVITGGAPGLTKARYYTVQSEAVVLNGTYEKPSDRIDGFPYRVYYYISGTGTNVKTYFRCLKYIASREYSSKWGYDLGSYVFEQNLEATRTIPTGYPDRNSNITQEFGNYIKTKRLAEGSQQTYEAMTLGEFKDTVRKFIKSFSDISTFNAWDSPMLGVYYEWKTPYDSSVSRREQFTIFSEWENYEYYSPMSAEIKDKTITIDTSRYGEVNVGSITSFTTESAENINSISTGEYVGNKCMYVVYDASTDTFYPVIKK
jgi:hypothetical protein